jgi:L-malate glycosyltransferase
MKIAFLALRHAIHTVRWVNALAERGHSVHLLSSTSHGDPLHEKVTFHKLPVSPPAGYFLNVGVLKQHLKTLEPDLLNAHFASGYGTLARLCNFHPYVLSVWGSDVFDFPAKSFLHRSLVRDNLKAADWICSTSQVMAEQTKRVFPDVRHLSVVPFGIDTNVFKPDRPKEKDTFTIGTVKTLASKYGVDLLLLAFAKLRQQLPPNLVAKLRLLIVGGGPDQEKLVSLARQLEIQDVTTFTGAVPHASVVHYLNQLDVYVALSRLDSESFGVAILEASACGLPVVVSDVGGLPEVVKQGQTGFIVPREDVGAAVQALAKLANDKGLRRQLGAAGRTFVQTAYEWELNVTEMETVYQNVLKR